MANHYNIAVRCLDSEASADLAIAERFGVSALDGAVVIFYEGTIVAACDEYGTAHFDGPWNEDFPKDRVQAFAETYCDLIEGLVPAVDARVEEAAQAMVKASNGTLSLGDARTAAAPAFVAFDDAVAREKASNDG